MAFIKIKNGGTWHEIHDEKKQDTLVGEGTGQNIKTVNGTNILGAGDITVGGEPGAYIKNIEETDNTYTATKKDDTTVTWTIPEVPTIATEITASSTNEETAGAAAVYGYHDTTKQDTINDANKLSADLINDASTTKKLVNEDDISKWNGKQDKIEGTELEALQSGITATKVGTYDGYQAEIDGKQRQIIYQETEPTANDGDVWVF